jgi:hypothetical protein
MIRFLFAYDNTTSFAAQDRLAQGNAAGKDFQVARIIMMGSTNS